MSASLVGSEMCIRDSPMVLPPDLVRDPNVQVLGEVLPPAPFFGLPPLGGCESHGTRYERRPWE
eukprot:7538866-Alexandrium_andersonii.AAC.1